MIPPILVDNKLVSDIGKANLFNNFFNKQCTHTSKNSTVSESINFETWDSLSSLEFWVNDIVKIIRLLAQNKTHGHNEISVLMTKLCPSSVLK